jgi:hypothetical protein
MDGEFERRAKSASTERNDRLDPRRLWMLPDFELAAEYIQIAPEHNGPLSQAIREEYHRRGLDTTQSE